MAQRVITQLVSDLSGKEIAEGEGRTVPFSFDGKSYTIDLTEKEAESFEEAMAKYLSAATRTSNPSSRRPGARTSAREDVGAIREWAKANGFSVSERGRIASEVREAYAAAH